MTIFANNLWIKKGKKKWFYYCISRVETQRNFYVLTPISQLETLTSVWVKYLWSDAKTQEGSVMHINLCVTTRQTRTLHRYSYYTILSRVIEVKFSCSAGYDDVIWYDDWTLGSVIFLASTNIIDCSVTVDWLIKEHTPWCSTDF